MASTGVKGVNGVNSVKSVTGAKSVNGVNGNGDERGCAVTYPETSGMLRLAVTHPGMFYAAGSRAVTHPATELFLRMRCRAVTYPATNPSVASPAIGFNPGALNRAVDPATSRAVTYPAAEWSLRLLR